MTCSLTPKQTDFDIFTGNLVYEPSPNFSYENIPEGCCVYIHQYQQMLVDTFIEINGHLELDGTLVIVD